MFPIKQLKQKRNYMNTNNRDFIHGLPAATLEQTLLAATRAAASITLPYFRSGLGIDNKLEEGFDPVTAADREAEKAIRQIIENNFDDHAIIGEEHGNKQTGSPFSWIIDPIDGTRAFITGVPVWGTLIGIAHEQKVFAGIMSQPFTGETFVSLGKQSLYIRGNSTPDVLATSRITSLGQARMMTTTPALFKGSELKAYEKLENMVRLARYGCDCYAYCLLAAGEVDLVVEAGLNIYDIAPLIPIIRNAGGTVTTFDGTGADMGGNIIAAATPELHQAAMEIMQQQT